jgi:hypothetical protein
MSSAPIAPHGLELLDPGIVVLELGERVAAGICGSLLADLGAEVVLADTRERDGFKWRNRSAVAVGKRSVAESAIEPDGPLERLLDQADVLLLSSDLATSQLEIWVRSSATSPASATAVRSRARGCPRR